MISGRRSVRQYSTRTAPRNSSFSCSPGRLTVQVEHREIRLQAEKLHILAMVQHRITN